MDKQLKVTICFPGGFLLTGSSPLQFCRWGAPNQSSTRQHKKHIQINKHDSIICGKQRLCRPFLWKFLGWITMVRTDSREHLERVRGTERRDESLSVTWSHHRTEMQRALADTDTQQWMGGLTECLVCDITVGSMPSPASGRERFIHKAGTAASTQDDATIDAEQATGPYKWGTICLL